MCFALDAIDIVLHAVATCRNRIGRIPPTTSMVLDGVVSDTRHSRTIAAGSSLGRPGRLWFP